MNGNHFGARWWRFDFHAHTPASYDYGKGPQQNVLKRMSPREWLLTFMRAKIDCVAITDHNVADWIDPLRAALSALQDELPADFRPLHLFPAIEISLYGNVHLLAIFDPELNGSHVTRFLGAAGLHGSDPKSAQQCSE